MKNNIKKYGDCDSKLKYWWQIIKPLLWYLLISILFVMFVGAIAIIANINSGFELVEAAGVTPAYDSSIINFLIDNLNIMSVIVIDLICGIIFYLMYIKIKDKEKNEKDKISIKNIIYIICLVIIVSSVYDLITNLLITSTDVNTAKVYSMIVTSSIPLVILGTVIIGPIMEEIWFRGIILKRLLMRFSSKTSIIISALLFGVFHLALVQGIGAFFIGLVLGYLYYKTKSLYPCIIAHMINNFISVLANYFDYNEILSISYSNFIICLLFLIVGVFMFIFDKHKKSINV